MHRGSGGETIITLMSDDNFNSLLQRNLLLLRFTLHDKRPGTRPGLNSLTGWYWGLDPGCSLREIPE